MEISILGFNLTKISGWKNPDFKGKLEINTSINISSIEKHEINLIKEDILKINFSFKITYKDFAEIFLEGNLLIKTDPKKIKEAIKEWKDKKLDSEFQTIILNLIMQKCSIRAIELEEELSLPIHIRMPSLKVEKKE
ncbi:MAG: hypothetical protein NC816_03660 [Candidatus Omnitrophica bacterium]|nr:hypothetical protein [Candidatus Omnitrophota bacterium]